MRIAIPVTNGTVSASLALCKGFEFFEDDHGRVTRRFFIEHTGMSAADAITLLEQYGIDALICGPISEVEQREAALAGLMVFPGAICSAEEAVGKFLSGAVARDPANTCNACGHNATCSIYAAGGTCS
jgi:predicted Fe-Mo cluster-binding NifX family protein